MEGKMIEKPRFFKLKKALLILFIVLSMIIMSYLLLSVIGVIHNDTFRVEIEALQNKFLVLQLSDVTVRIPPSKESKTLNSCFPPKQTARILFITIFSIFTLCQLLGMYGAYREQFCLVLLYALMQFLVTVSDVLQLALYRFNAPMWIAASWSLIVSFFVLLYLRDLYWINQQQQQLQKEPEIEE